MPKQEVRERHILQAKELPCERISHEHKIEFVFVKRLRESWTAIEGCLLRAQHVYRDQRTCSVIEDRALPVQTASYAELWRLSK